MQMPNATGLGRKSGGAQSKISVWMLFPGNVFRSLNASQRDLEDSRAHAVQLSWERECRSVLSRCATLQAWRVFSTTFTVIQGLRLRSWCARLLQAVLSFFVIVR
jgi:hypothetical protein